MQINCLVRVVFSPTNCDRNLPNKTGETLMFSKIASTFMNLSNLSDPGMSVRNFLIYSTRNAILECAVIKVVDTFDDKSTLSD